MKTKEWGKPNFEMNGKPIKVQDASSLVTQEATKPFPRPTQFRSVGKMYKKIAGKRYRLPRKVKKRFKTNMCKHGWNIKKLKFSYKRLNRDVDGKRNN